MRNLPPEHQETVLDAMQLAFDRGSVPCLRSFIDDYESAFLSSPSPQVRERYTVLVDAAREGFAHEEIHGRYSLLKLDHPVNLLFVAQGIVEDPARQLISQASELETRTT